MPEFASCYFCGTALDAHIEPYPVVPEDAGADDQPTVDLCPVCRRKLSKVLDVALSAAEGTEPTTPLAAGPDPSPLEADHEDPTADLGGGETTDEPAYAVEPSGEATAVEDTAESDDDADVDEEGDVASPAQDDEDDDSQGPADPEADDWASETTVDQSASVESATEADDAVANGEAPGRVADDGAEPEDTEADDHTGASEAETAESGSDEPSILSTPAAQKVIKLLQNREFPVEREEIEVVASNAYEIPQQDCADVIDTLVSEGYVGERTGKLVRPEE